MDMQPDLNARNRRRTEDHFHAFWNAVLGHLVYGHTNLCVAPQTEESNAHRGPTYADTSLETEEGKDVECRPDFLILGIRATNRFDPESPENQSFPPVFSDWIDMRFQRAFPHILIELKTVPVRNLRHARDFTVQLDYIFADAWSEAQDQAIVAFGREDFKDLNSVLVILGVGEWWRLGFITREVVEENAKNIFVYEAEKVEIKRHRGKRAGYNVLRARPPSER